MTIQEWITEAEMYEYSADNYNMTKLLGEIELTEMAIRSYELIQSNTVYTEGVDLVNIFTESDDNVVIKTKEGLGEKIQKAWDWICKTISSIGKAIVSFITGKKKSADETAKLAKSINDDIKNIDFTNINDTSPAHHLLSDQGSSKTVVDDNNTTDRNLLDEIDNMCKALYDEDLIALYNNNHDGYDSSTIDGLINYLKSEGMDNVEIKSIMCYFKICDKCEDYSLIPSYMKSISSISLDVAKFLNDDGLKDTDKLASFASKLKNDVAECLATRDAKSFIWIENNDVTRYLSGSLKGELSTSTSTIAVFQVSKVDVIDLFRKNSDSSKYMNPIYLNTYKLYELYGTGFKFMTKTSAYERKVCKLCRSIIDKFK